MDIKYTQLNETNVQIGVTQPIFVYAPLATITRAGVIKVGSGLIINEQGVLSTTTSNENITKQIEDAIGEIEDGTKVAGRAENDSSGRKIEDTYVTDLSPSVSYYESGLEVEVALHDGNGLQFRVPSFNIDAATQSLAGVMSAEDKTRLDKTLTSEDKGVVNGVAPLDANNKLPLLYLYDGVLGQLEYAGTFNGVMLPTTTQNLSPNRAVRKGDYFIANGNGIISGVDFKVGDWLVFDSPSAWQKIDNTDAVASVNGKMGVVVLTPKDIVFSTGGGTLDGVNLETAVIGLTNNKSDKATTYTKEEVDNLLVNFEPVGNASRIIYNSSTPSDLTENDLWIQII